jgi:tripartite-type tricarboxylate transporter receptor subunit TctC
MRFVRSIVLFSFATLIAPSAFAQSYPNRPIRLVIPMAAGGATDILLRTITPRMSELFGQQVVVDNRPAANGILGDEMAVKSAPDGYTLHATSLAITINPSMYKLSYDVRRDLTPVTQIGLSDLIMGVPSKLPVKTVQDFINLAKSQPGKLNYASFGVGSIAHVAGEMFKQATNTQIVHVAYKATPLAVQETVAGQTQFLFGSISYMLPQVRAGRMTAIGLASLQRNPLTPDIATLDEQGLKGFNVTAWFGMWMPARVPKPILNRVYEVVAQSLKDQRASIEKLAYKPGGEPPEQFGKFVNSEVDKFARVVKTAGIKIEN